VAILEAAVTLPIFLTLVLVTIDVGMFVFRQHVVFDAARSAARIAIVHGSESFQPWSFTEPGGKTVDLNSNDPIALALKPTLVVPDANAKVTLVWLDRDIADPVHQHVNDPGRRVGVIVKMSDYRPLITAFIFGDVHWQLSSTSIMTIAH